MLCKGFSQGRDGKMFLIDQRLNDQVNLIGMDKGFISLDIDDQVIAI
jgi:hypothetical protein